MRIAVFGLGYVGTVTAAGLASCGHEVCGVDVDAVKVENIRSGQSPVVEPGIEELLATAVRDGLLTATTDPVEALERADVSLLCVGTPSMPQGGTNLAYMRRALEDIREALSVATPPASGFHAVVVRSTVPPGTGDDVVRETFLAMPPETDGWSIGTAMCPEFLREGSGVADFFNPPFVVLGTADPRVTEVMTELFSFLDREIRLVDVRSAEALKYACNAFHATKISFANEMARIFRMYGVDSREVMKVFSEDKILNISPAYLTPGFAFGGSCLPKDLRSLLDMARANSLDVPLLSGTLHSNELVIRDAVDRLIASPYRTVAMLGLSFKMNTDDLREISAAEIAIPTRNCRTSAAPFGASPSPQTGTAGGWAGGPLSQSAAGVASIAPRRHRRPRAGRRCRSQRTAPGKGADPGGGEGPGPYNTAIRPRRATATAVVVADPHNHQPERKLSANEHGERKALRKTDRLRPGKTLVVLEGHRSGSHPGGTGTTGPLRA